MSDVFTMEQKARAFDTLWSSCGDGGASFLRYERRKHPTDPQQGITIPVYSFEINYVGNVRTFKDVLKELAIRE